MKHTDEKNYRHVLCDKCGQHNIIGHNCIDLTDINPKKHTDDGDTDTRNFEEEREWAIFEQGFEEGYAVAKRLYKPKYIYYATESGLPTEKLIH